MAEPFDIKKLLTSPFTGLYWVKVIAIGAGIFFLVFDGYGLYKAYFKKPDPTTTQKADTINNKYNYYQPKQTFGCMHVYPEGTIK
jgi:hypothetical protein